MMARRNDCNAVLAYMNGPCGRMNNYCDCMKIENSVYILYSCIC